VPGLGIDLNCPEENRGPAVKPGMRARQARSTNFTHPEEPLITMGQPYTFQLLQKESPSAD
jgi:hypothetical protein